MGLPKGLAIQKKLFNKKYVVEKRPKRWTRDPVVKKKYYKHKRKKPKKHTVKRHIRGGFLPLVGGFKDSHQIFGGLKNTFFSRRLVR